MHNVQSTTKKQIFLKPFLSFADLRQNQELVTSVSGRGIETVTALRNRLTKVKVGEPQGAEDELGEEEEWQVVDEYERSYVRIAISRKRHFRSPKRKNENTLLYKEPPQT